MQFPMAQATHTIWQEQTEQRKSESKDGKRRAKGGKNGKTAAAERGRHDDANSGPMHAATIARGTRDIPLLARRCQRGQRGLSRLSVENGCPLRAGEQVMLEPTCLRKVMMMM